MSNDDVQDISILLEQLELEQEEELAQLQQRHRIAKRALLRRLTGSSPRKSPAPTVTPATVLSHSQREIHLGETVYLRTTTTIGCKGDTAIVTGVAPSRIDVRVPRLKDHTWRKPHNISHYRI